GWSGSPSIWKISGVAFLALSPRLYISSPQLTEQYGQVLRVSMACASLKWRVSASAAAGEKPSAAMVEAASPAALTCRNCLRVMSIGRLLSFLFLRIRRGCGRPVPAGRRRRVALSGRVAGSGLVLAAGHPADGGASGGRTRGRRVGRDLLARRRRRDRRRGRGGGGCGIGGAVARRGG